ncbi:hypothetical protein K501DRAFT_334335 [Backusella circina FSU 941]|nr:hypothetical protein K501DRAFT_334335 [Backusella circina FSU 941]
MNHLPREVLSEIFLYLRPSDKVECLLVCSHWNQVITSSVLYHTLWLSCIEDVNIFMGKIREHPDIAKRVDKIMLTFDHVTMDGHCVIPLLQILPNIQTLICSFEEIHNVNVQDGTLFAFHDHIKYILENSCTLVTHQLLSTGVCPKLTTLDIDDFKNIIPHLKNAPALRHLSLHRSSLCSDNLDTIHKFLPKLNRLRLVGVFLDSLIFDRNLEPAASLTALVLDNVIMNNRPTRIDLLVYISMKYPNMTELICDFFNNGLNSGEIENQRKHGWMPLFKSLGPQLNRLRLSYPMSHLFETLDEFGCKIRQLEIGSLEYSTLASIVKSQQLHYIQDLTLKNIKFQSFHWLSQLKVLKSLKVVLRKEIKYPVPIYLNDILDNAPSTLRSLYLGMMALKIDPDYTGVSDIESLTLFYVCLPEGIDIFLSHHFPKLSKLTLENARGFENVLHLPTLNLSYFGYYDICFHDEKNVLVATADNNERRIYSANRSIEDKMTGNQYKTFYCQLYTSHKSRMADESDAKPWFSLYCNSLDYISIGR